MPKTPRDYKYAVVLNIKTPILVDPYPPIYYSGIPNRRNHMFKTPLHVQIPYSKPGTKGNLSQLRKVEFIGEAFS